MKILKSPPCAIAALFVVSQLSHAAVVNFTSGATSWDHGGGESGAWNDGETSGSASVLVGLSNVTVTVSGAYFGSGVDAGGTFRNINETFFQGFAFQPRSGTVDNGGAFNSYFRLDITFSQAVSIDQFTINDLDSDDDYIDLLYVEGWNGADFGSYGSGEAANYSYDGSFLQEVNRFGESHVRDQSNGSDTPLSPGDARGNLGFDFQGTSLEDTGVTHLSIYYSNDKNNIPNDSSTQTIGIVGDQFSIQEIPEPSTFSLLGILGFTLILRRRK
jgi:hypothetical protein